MPTATESDPPEQPPAQKSPEEVAAGQRRFNRGCASTGLGLVVLAIVIGILTSGDQDDRELRETDAELACQDWVRGQLRGPSTAQFVNVYTRTGQADLTEADVYAGRSDDDVLTVRGSVDAQNGFGATVREPFTCEVRDTGEGWQLLDLQMG